MRRRFDESTRINRTAVGQHGEHQPVVTDVIQILDQPGATVVEGRPIVEAAPAPGVKRFAGREVLWKQRAVVVSSQQALAGQTSWRKCSRQSAWLSRFANERGEMRAAR